MWKDRAVSPNPSQDKSHFRLFKHRPGFDGLCHKHLICWSWSLPTFWHFTNGNFLWAQEWKFGETRTQRKTHKHTHTGKDTQTHAHRKRHTNTRTQRKTHKHTDTCAHLKKGDLIVTQLFSCRLSLSLLWLPCASAYHSSHGRDDQNSWRPHSLDGSSFGLMWHQGSARNGCSGLRGETPAKMKSHKTWVMEYLFNPR